MKHQEINKNCKRPEDQMILAQISDKIQFAQTRGTIEVSDFLDMYQIAMVSSFLRKQPSANYELTGGYEEAERKIVVIKGNKNQEIKQIQNEFLNVLRITLPEKQEQAYMHRNYLGGIVKIGMKREKVGDILVNEKGADIIVKHETAQIMKQELAQLTRFEQAKFEILPISELRKAEVKMEERTIIVPSMRLDNFVSDLAKTSRNKAVQILASERVFINGQNETKPAKQVKLGDVITIRGKGRFVVREMTGNTRSGRAVIKIEKYG